MASLLGKDQIVVVLSGMGGVGKSTQAKLIADTLSECGQKVCLLKLPCYETPTGEIIANTLSGAYRGIPKGYPLQELFAVNRAEVARFIKSGLRMGWSCVVDRWVLDNALSIFDTMKKYEKEIPRSEEFNFLHKLDTDFLELFKNLPVIKIMLEAGPTSLREFRKDRGDEVENDIFEKEGEEDRTNLLREFAKFEGDWEIIKRHGREAHETHNRCMARICGKVGINTELARKIPLYIKRGEIIDFNSEIVTLVFRKEDKELPLKERLERVWDCEESVRSSNWGRNVIGRPSYLDFFTEGLNAQLPNRERI